MVLLFPPSLPYDHNHEHRFVAPPAAGTAYKSCIFLGIEQHPVCMCICRAAAQAPYTGPVPLVTHVHGSDGVGDESDGYPEAWFLSASCQDAEFKDYAKVRSIWS